MNDLSSGRARRHGGPSAQTCPQRIAIGHAIPHWVRPGGLFFITICCRVRGQNILCREPIATELLDSVRYQHEHERWYARLFLLMPDHLHALLAFPTAESMPKVIGNWKAYTARQFGIDWQKNFFDHRLRSDESWENKAAYIRQNPARAGLIPSGAPWPYLIER
jgi:REP element-mobilizing transposase RayT